MVFNILFPNSDSQKKNFAICRVYPVHWPLMIHACVKPISISIKDGAHVSLHENAAGILKWFGGARQDAHDLRINGFTGRSRVRDECLP